VSLFASSTLISFKRDKTSRDSLKEVFIFEIRHHGAFRFSFVQLQRLGDRGHKPFRHEGYKPSFTPARLMPVAPEQGASAFLIHLLL
jgi:hypothetical protein